MSTTLYRQADFGVGKTGLTTVGYRLYDADGDANGSRITAGVAERGATGIYGASVVFPAAFDGEIRWDTGEVPPLYASEDCAAALAAVNAAAAAVSAKAVTDKLDTMIEVAP